jgi:hypothetical protein
VPPQALAQLVDLEGPHQHFIRGPGSGCGLHRALLDPAGQDTERGETFQRLLLGPGHLFLVCGDVPNRQEDAGGEVFGPPPAVRATSECSGPLESAGEASRQRVPSDRRSEDRGPSRRCRDGSAFAGGGGSRSGQQRAPRPDGPPQPQGSCWLPGPGVKPVCPQRRSVRHQPGRPFVLVGQDSESAKLVATPSPGSAPNRRSGPPDRMRQLLVADRGSDRQSTCAVPPRQGRGHRHRHRLRGPGGGDPGGPAGRHAPEDRGFDERTVMIGSLNTLSQWWTC